MMLTTHLPIKLNNQLSIYTETSIKQEETVITPTSSPSPPASSPHSPAEETGVPSSPPELPEILSLCQRLNPSIEDLNKKRISAAEFMNVLVRELTPFINKNLGPKKTIKKKRERGSRKCSICLTESTPEWRRDPEGLVTLCNACGLKVKKKARSVPQTAITSPSYNGQRFIWNQQNGTGTLSPAEYLSPPIHRQQKELPQNTPQIPAYMSSPAQKQYTPAPIYQPFNNYKIEDCHQVYNNQTRYLQSPMIHPENLNSLPNMNQQYQYQYYYNDDSFPYQPSTQSHQHHHEDCKNCPQCFVHYAAY